MSIKIEAHIKDYICTWPNGETRVVRVIRKGYQKSVVIWNDRLGDPPPTSVVGAHEQVPNEWLSEYIEQPRIDCADSGFNDCL